MGIDLSGLRGHFLVDHRVQIAHGGVVVLRGLCRRCKRCRVFVDLVRRRLRYRELPKTAVGLPAQLVQLGLESVDLGVKGRLVGGDVDVDIHERQLALEFVELPGNRGVILAVDGDRQDALGVCDGVFELADDARVADDRVAVAVDGDGGFGCVDGREQFGERRLPCCRIAVDGDLARVLRLREFCGDAFCRLKRVADIGCDVYLGWVRIQLNQLRCVDGDLPFYAFFNDRLQSLIVIARFPGGMTERGDRRARSTYGRHHAHDGQRHGMQRQRRQCSLDAGDHLNDLPAHQQQRPNGRDHAGNGEDDLLEPAVVLGEPLHRALNGRDHARHRRQQQLAETLAQLLDGLHQLAALVGQRAARAHEVALGVGRLRHHVLVAQLHLFGLRHGADLRGDAL